MSRRTDAYNLIYMTRLPLLARTLTIIAPGPEALSAFQASRALWADHYTKTEKVKAVSLKPRASCTDGVLIYLPLVPMQAFHCAHFTFPR